MVAFAVDDDAKNVDGHTADIDQHELGNVQQKEKGNPRSVNDHSERQDKIGQHVETEVRGCYSRWQAVKPRNSAYNRQFFNPVRQFFESP